MEWIADKVGSKNLVCVKNKVKDHIDLRSYQSDAEVGIRNSGKVASAQRNLKENPCFSNLYYNFNARLNRLSSVAYPTDVKNQKPTLGEFAGQGRFAKIQPGFALDLAMETAKGDPRLALELIGVCGHDDYHTLPELGNLELPVQAQLRGALDRSTGDPDERARKAAKDELKTLQIEVAETKSELDRFESSGIRKFIHACSPETEKMLLAIPGAIGKELDIPQKLKEKISLLQSDLPVQSTFIKSKSYHFVTGAYLGCSLASCGINASSAGLIAEGLAELYRGQKLCTDLRALNESRHYLDTFIAADHSSASYRDKLERTIRNLRSEKNMAFDSKKYKNMTSALYILQTVPDEFFEKKLSQFLVSTETAALYEETYLGGPKSLLPCSSYRDPIKMAKSLFQKDACSQFGLSKAECENSKKHLAGWIVDFEWTREQHRIGAEFGRKLCTNQPESFSLNDASCQVLKSPSSDQNKNTGTE